VGYRGNAGKYLTLWNRATPPFSFTISTATMIGCYIQHNVAGKLVGLSAFLAARTGGFVSYGFVADDSGLTNKISYVNFEGYKKNTSVAGWTSGFIHPIQHLAAHQRYKLGVVYFAGNSTSVPCMLNGTNSSTDRTVGSFVIPHTTTSVPNGGTTTGLTIALTGTMNGFIPAIDVLFLPD